MAKGSGGKEVGRISIKVVPDTDDFRDDLKGDLERFERTLRTKVSVDPDTTGFREEVADETSGLEAKVDLDVDRAMLSRLRDKVSGSLRKVELPDPKIGGMNAAGVGLAGLVGLLALAGPLVGLLTTALAAVPGLIAAVAAPVGALALGMDGLKKSASRLAEPFAQLKETMSGFTESQFGPVFDKLGSIFPMLDRSLPAVTQGMADLASSVVNTITSSGGMQKIETAIGNIATALTTAAPGIGSFTNGLLGLVQSFTGKLPGVSEWFNTVGASFDKWVDKVTKDGSLSSAFDGLGATLKTIGETLVSLADKGIEFMKDPQRIEKFNTALTGLGTSLKSIIDDSTRFYNVMQDIKSVFTDWDFSGITDDLTKPFTSQEAGWRDMWESIKSGAQAAWSAVTGFVSAAVANISSIVSSIGASISGVWNGITSAASSAWNSVVAAVQSAWSAIVSAVSAGVDQAVAFVASLPGKIQTALGNLLTIGLEAGKNLVQGMVNGIGSMVSAAVAKARELASSVAGAVTSFLGINSPSKLFTDYGKYTGEGFALGLKNSESAVIKQAQSMMDGVNGVVSDSVIDFEEQLKTLSEIPMDFGKAVGGQFMSDLGIGGNGAIPAIAGYGLDWASQIGTNLTFNVSSVDEALAVQRNHQNKQALGLTRR